jgi:hypothetical protein
MARLDVRWIGLLWWSAFSGPLTANAQTQSPAPAAPAPPQAEFRLPDDRLGCRIAPILLLSREGVRTDLKLDEHQTVMARQAAGELYAQAAALKGKSGEKVADQRRQIDKACQGWINQWLSPDQQKRLTQIELQWEGPSALISQPTLAAQVGLSSSQKRRLTEAVDQCNARRATGTPVLEAERELAEATLAVLQENQRERWKAMMGPVFRPSIVDDAVMRASTSTEAAPK